MKPAGRGSFALFALGFRPFFLGAGVLAVAAMAVWLATLSGMPAPMRSSPVVWHAHEMLFGFAGAVIAGFLLAAVRNWTNLPTPSGASLGALFVLWLAGRAAPFIADWPGVACGAAGLLFLPAVALAIARPILKARQPRNYAFPVMLLVLAAAQALVAAEMWNLGATAHLGLSMAALLIVLMMVVMGGRVIPFFTERRLAGFTPRRSAIVDTLAIGLALIAPVLVFAAPTSPLTVALCAAAAVVHAVRLALWHERRLWSVPLLWILHLGYAWIPLGFALQALAGLGMAPPTVALHAFTAGAMGALTLGMMARVTLGHTGRPLEPPRVMTLAFIAVNAAAAVRVILPLVAPGHYIQWIRLGGLLWMLAFGLFAAIYAPMLWRARVDGKPG